MLVQIVSLLAAASAVTAQSSTVTPAPQVTGNPSGASYVATLPLKDGSSLAGSIVGSTGPDGKGVKFAVNFAGLPEAGGPFMYHIHAKPVPSDGNCTGTGAHLDPYVRGEVPICDATKPETCQTGDLSGKHGNITERSWAQEYTDLYSSTIPTDPAFFGSLSFVVHLSNKTRIGCANFTVISAGEAAPVPVPSGYLTSASSGAMPHPSEIPHYNTTAVATSTVITTGVPIPPTSAAPSAPAEFTNGAVAKMAGSAGILLAAAAAIVL